MIKEVWKVIDNNPDYTISNLGNVHSNKSNITLKPFLNKNGYLYVNLYTNKKYQKFTIHSLVAIAFILNPENKKYINHKDGNKQNNYYSNLEWSTFSENMIHAYEYGLIKPVWKDKFGYDHNRSKAVKQYSTNNEYINEFGSIREASRKLNINAANIMSVCQNVRKSAGGFIWKYV